MMMMNGQHRHPTVEIPSYEDPTATGIFSPQTNNYFSALRRYLPSSSSDLDNNLDDNFRMYEFKVRKCARGRSHDWTECPYAHPGEKARRRDPRKYHYSGTACPEFRRGNCRKGDSCELSHGVFECWLHPARYRTQPCKDGPHCSRRVCFFAHSPDQLRLLSETTPTCGLTELTTAIRDLHINLNPQGPTVTPTSGGRNVNVWAGLQMGFLSPSASSPTEVGYKWGEEEEVPMERVESGKGVRARMYAKLSLENSLVRDPFESVVPAPDFGWVSELVN